MNQRLFFFVSNGYIFAEPINRDARFKSKKRRIKREKHKKKREQIENPKRAKTEFIFVESFDSKRVIQK